MRALPFPRLSAAASRPTPRGVAAIAVTAALAASLSAAVPTHATTVAATVSLVDDIAGGYFSSNPSDLTALGSDVLFFASASTNDLQLWVSDGTQSGTQALTSLTSAGGNGFTSAPDATLTAVAGNEMYFVATANDGSYTPQLWKSDGTVAGTVSVGALPNSVSGLVAMGNSVYFEDYSHDGGQIWTSDGTTISQVTDVTAPYGFEFYTPLFVAGNEMYFGGGTNGGSDSDQLWKSDGTAVGTEQISSVSSDVSGLGLDPQTFAAVGNEIYFMGTNATSATPGADWQLWKSDGVNAPVQVSNVDPTNGGWEPATPVVIGTDLYFQASTQANGQQIWRVATANGDVISPVTDDSMPPANPGDPSTPGGTFNFMTGFAGSLYFNDSTSTDPTVQGLWRSDVTALDATSLTHLTSEQSVRLTPAGSLLFFDGEDSTGGDQVWQTDGTAGGTLQDSNIGTTNGPNYSLQNMTAVGNVLFFADNDGNTGQELWKADPGGGTGGATDRTPPTIGFVEQPTGNSTWFTTTPASVTVTATDTGGSGLASYSCLLDGAAPTTVTPNGTASEVISTSAPGSHVVSCTATDNAGNTTTGTAADQAPLDVDTAAPTVQYTDCPPTAPVLLGSSATVHWAASDPTPGSGLASSASGTQPLNTSAAGVGSVSSPIPSDVAGNTGSSQSCSYVVQYALNLVTPTNGGTYKHGTARRASKLQITAQLKNSGGTLISDTEAAGLVSSSNCRVNASGTGAQSFTSTCMTYSKKSHQFTATWLLGPATGAAQASVNISYPATAVTTTATNNFTIN